MRTSRRSMLGLAPARTLGLALSFATVLAGCDGPGVVSPGAVRFGQVGGGAALDVVGTWRRTIFFLDDDGIARSSETTWRFASDGSVTRIQVARNLTLGLADVVVSAGRYRLENTAVIVDFITPAAATLSYEIRRAGNQLILAGQTYLRVGG